MESINVALAKKGDRKAFENLIRPLMNKLRWRAAKAVGEGYADDVVQNTCLQAFLKLDSFRGNSKFSSWFYVIGTNAIRMHIRTESRRTKGITYPRSSVEYPGNPIENIPSDHSLHDQTEVRQELRETLKMVDNLPQNYKEPLYLQVVGGLDLVSIGETMGLTTAAVKSRIHRARAALKSGNLAA